MCRVFWKFLDSMKRCGLGIVVGIGKSRGEDFFIECIDFKIK